jgi:predicted NBD/HSP70 family sugar kinase
VYDGVGNGPGTEEQGGVGMRGSSMPDVGDYNERLVLQAIRRSEEGVAQVEVAELSGLSRQAVSVITRRLLGRGLIEVAGRRLLGRGKPQTLLRMRPMSGLAAGIHLDPWFITVTIVDLLARPLARVSIDPPTDDPASDVERIRAALSSLFPRAVADVSAAPECHEVSGDLPGPAVADGAVAADGTDGEGAGAGPGAGTGFPDPRLLGIGIAAPGGLDTVRGVVTDPPWLPGWRDVPIARLLAEAVGVPTYLDKDTSAALTGERWSRHLPADETVLYLYVGSGIGSAVSTGGRVHRGGTGQAGEIGHFPTGLSGPRCICGRYSCLNLFTDTEAMVYRARREGILDAPECQGNSHGLECLVRAAESEQPQALEVLTDHGRALGEVLRTLLNVHDPDRVIIGGPSWKLLAPTVLPVVRRRALAGAPGADPSIIESAEVGDDVGAIGAASIVLEQEMDPSSSEYREVGRNVPALRTAQETGASA